MAKDDSGAASSSMAEDSYAPLLGNSVGLGNPAGEDAEPQDVGEEGIYNEGVRPVRDLGFGVAYLATLGMTLGGGVYAYVNSPSDFFVLSDSEYLAVSRFHVFPPLKTRWCCSSFVFQVFGE